MINAYSGTTTQITIEWLKQQKFIVTPLSKVPTIPDVILKDLSINLDGRGEVTVLWSKPWTEEGLLEVAHVYQSATDFGVVKSWHYHSIHTDQITCTRGKLQLTLVDLREGSPTFCHVNVIFLGTLKPRLVVVPPGVMHGWKALSEPEVLVVNLQTHVYTPNDEIRFPWDCVLTDIWEPKNG